jgi:hypothetical protein
MIQSILHKTLVFVSALVITMGMKAQGIRVDATVNKKQILIGEQITLTLTADIPENEPISFFTVDTIPHFEFIIKPAADTSNTNNGTRIVQEMVITSFDSGRYVIPSFQLAPGIVTDSIPIDIGFTPGFDPKKPYHDIKDVLDVPVPKKPIPWWWWAIGGGALLLVALLIYLLRRKKPQAAAIKTEPPVNAYEEAMKQMEQLQRNKPAAKEYYSQMVDIFRQYVLRRKNIHSLQKTTDDLVSQLKEIGMDRNSFDQLAQALRLGDYVKFAKYQPVDSDDSTFYQGIRESIITIEKTASPISIKGGKA